MKVSIIIPLYKSEKYIRKLADSILNQTYQDLEVVFIDDGSPDRSGTIADEYASRDDRFKSLHQKNGGTCAARNRGLSEATGEYIMFADGDDWLEPDCVEYLVSLLENNNADMSMTDSIFTTRDRKQNDIDNVRIWTNKEAVAGIINTFIIPVGPWNKLYKSNIIKDKNISFSVAWFGEGLYFSAMVAQASPRVAVGHRKIYDYRLNNPNSGCTQREVKNGISSLNNIFYIRDQITLRSPKITEAFNWHIWTNYFNLLTYIVGAKEENKYHKELTKSKKELKHYEPMVIKHSLLSPKQKVGIVLKSYLPVYFAKRSLKRAEKAFAVDTME